MQRLLQYCLRLIKLHVTYTITEIELHNLWLFMWQNLRNVRKVELSLPVGEAAVVESRMGTEMLFSNSWRTYHIEFLLQTLTHERIRRCMRVTLRKSLCLSTLMFSLLHAHGNVC